MSEATDRLARMSVFDPECLSRRVLEHATSRWGALTLAVLLDGPLRFAQVRRSVNGISDRMLAQTLQRLEEDGLVVRQAQDEKMSKVVYTLSEIGLPIARSVEALIRTIYDQVPAIVTHQRQRAAR